VHPYVVKERGQTDLAFLLGRAQRIGFELRAEGKTLVFRKAKDDRPKTCTLVWGRPYQGLASDRDVLPLKSFRPTMNALNQVNEVIVRGYDKRTKKPIEGRAGAGTERTAMGGRQTGAAVAAQAFDWHRKEVHVRTPVASQEEADQLARALYDERARAFVTGHGSTIGLPGIQAGCVIELQGLGPRFSGLYYVTRSTHRLNGSGYLTDFDVKRKAI
jgi:phage protein D